MNIEQLRYVKAVIETGSMKDAAQKIFATPQAVSKGIKRFELECGSSLFVRTGTRLDPTELCLSILPNVERALYELETIEQKSKSFGVAPQMPKSITVGVGHSSFRVAVFSPENIERIQAAFPQTDIEFVYVSNGSCFFATMAGHFDISFVVGSIQSDKLCVSPILKSPVYVAMLRSHPLARKYSISLADLSDREVACPFDLVNFYSELVASFEETGLSAPRFASGFFGEAEFESFLNKGGLVFVDARTTQIQSIFPDVVLVRTSESGFPPLTFSAVHASVEAGDWRPYFVEQVERLCFLENCEMNV